MNKNQALLAFSSKSSNCWEALIFLNGILDTYKEAANYYGQGAFYGNSQQDGAESVYWSKQHSELKAFIKKYEH